MDILGVLIFFVKNNTSNKLLDFNRFVLAFTLSKKHTVYFYIVKKMNHEQRVLSTRRP